PDRRRWRRLERPGRMGAHGRAPYRTAPGGGLSPLHDQLFAGAARMTGPDLPELGFSGRWTPARKEAVAVAIRRGELTVAEALNRWGLSVEELDAWLMAYRRRGRDGLSARALPGRMI